MFSLLDAFILLPENQHQTEKWFTDICARGESPAGWLRALSSAAGARLQQRVHNTARRHELISTCNPPDVILTNSVEMLSCVCVVCLRAQLRCQPVWSHAEASSPTSRHPKKTIITYIVLNNLVDVKGSKQVSQILTLLLTFSPGIF